MSASIGSTRKGKGGNDFSSAVDAAGHEKELSKLTPEEAKEPKQERDGSRSTPFLLSSVIPPGANYLLRPLPAQVRGSQGLPC